MKEVFQGQTVWDGIVEVFDLHGHPKANTAYAWSHETDDPDTPTRHVTVLHIPPAVSPETAVRAAIVQEFRSAEPKPKKAGRPPLPKGDAKIGTLRVRVTPEELKTIEAAARAKKMTVSEWIRVTLMENSGETK